MGYLCETYTSEAHVCHSDLIGGESDSTWSITTVERASMADSVAAILSKISINIFLLQE